MGGYGIYVWPCYGLTVLVLLAMEWVSQRQLEEARRHALRRAQVSGGQS